MRKVTRASQLNNEHGAVVALVAISLVAVMGMVVLVVDVGGLLTLRRRLVGASDSAALAAAQSCAMDDAGEALSQADVFAADNVAEASRYYQDDGGTCGTSGTGYITLGYKADKELYFAPILGLGDSRPVAHKSTAIWGAALASNPVPIKVSTDGSGSRIPCEVGEGERECNMWFDNPAESGLDSSSSWGFMNLNEWGVDYDASCNVNGGAADRGDWITGEEIVDKSLDTIPTYVCMGKGQSAVNWYQDLVSQIGQLKYFPVNDPSRMNYTSGKEKYAIVGFTPLRITDVLRGNDPEAIGTPGIAPVDESCRASHDFAPGETVALWTLPGPGCPGGAQIPQTISNLKISKKHQGNEIVLPEGVAYDYDPVLQEVTWKAAAFPPLEDFKNVSVDFDWHIDGTPGTPGECGLHDPEPNGICLVLTWEGPIIGGFEPCEEACAGKDFGIRAIRLDKTR